MRADDVDQIDVGRSFVAAAAPVIVDDVERGIADVAALPVVAPPRVVGTQVGQTLQVRNSDPMLHNVHSLSTGTNGFNVGQPSAGMVYTVQLKQEEIMLRLKCDVHRWMTAYIGVVSHPYFAVSGTGGTFEIANVPVGTYTIQT